MFSEGREDVNDEGRAGRPSTSTADEKINEVEKMILANRRITVREVAEDLNISIGSCHSIFINDLGMRRVAAKFVPKLLNCDQKQHRMNIANEMLDSVRDDPNLLQRVITGDEAWVYGYDVETKAQSSQWKLPHEPRPKKARQVRSNVKVLLTVFFDCRGVVHHEFLPQGRTVNKEYYLQVMRNLREAIRQKRPDLWKNKNWLLHHDNAPAHTSLLVRDFLVKNNTLMIPQPPYSPDLAPCDFFLFPKLKRPMKGRRYATLDEIKTASKEELKKIFKNDFLKCFEDWKNRWHKSSSLLGDEKGLSVLLAVVSSSLLGDEKGLSVLLAVVSSSLLTNLSHDNHETFDFSTPNEWPKWRKRFERYLVVSGMKKKEEADKIDLFMYLMGDRADDIFRTFKFEKEEEATKIDSVLKAFDSHFCVIKNIIYERAKFNSRIQEDREPVDEFITSLYKLADSCEFEGLYEQLIRDRIVVGVRDKALSERMQLDSELTLEKAVKMVRQQEAVRQQQVDLQRPSTSQKVNQVKFNSKKQSPKQQQQPSRKKEKSAKTRSRCPKCGGFTHREGQACRAEGQKSVEDSSNLDNDEVECRRRWTAEIQVNGKKVKFKLDSQADVTCVPLCLFKKIMGQQRLVESDINLRATEFSELQTVGMFISALRNGNYEIKEKIYVIRRLSEPLLSRRACELLNLARRIEVVATRINPIKEFPEVFEGLGQIGNPYEIKLKPGAKPYAVHTPRRVPIPLMEKLKTRLEELEKAGIIAQVNIATEWCAPPVIAGKPNGDIRLCVDLSRPNEHVQREVHPMPVVEHMLGQLGEARFFSKLDANSGFHQIPLSPDCQHLTTFITPFGRYKYCRMPFGISLAPEYFQKVMSIILQGMDGVMCYLDDILIFASDSKTHDRILRLVLRKLKEAKVTLNKAKCVFGVPRINFLGHILDEDGIRPDPAKIEAVAKMPAPTDVHGVRRFLGMVNHLGRFVENLSEIVAPLNQLLVKGQDFVWDCSQERAFRKLKELLTTQPILAAYDVRKPTMVSSRRIFIRLGSGTEARRFGFEIVHIPGKELLDADALSRQPLLTTEGGEDERPTSAHINAVLSSITDKDEMLTKTFEAQQEDTTLKAVVNYLEQGWPDKKKMSQALLSYWHVKDELGVQNGLLMRSCRLVIPASMKLEILDKLHAGHFGITKTRLRARETVWWPGISEEIAETVRKCSVCIQEAVSKHEPLIPTNFPTRPWQKIGMDLFKFENKWYLVVIDYYSRFPEMIQLDRLTASVVVRSCKSIFARHGIPETVVSDNGTQFGAAREFANFARQYGFTHVTSSPRFPQNNGMAEAGVKIAKLILKKNQDPSLGLLEYRSTPLENGYSPAELLMGRKLRTTLPIAPENLNPRYDRRCGATDMEELSEVHVVQAMIIMSLVENRQWVSSDTTHFAIYDEYVDRVLRRLEDGDGVVLETNWKDPGLQYHT
ncbi:K02A2.6-like [Cordylochernes scorpioides]|uniref:RNA-directed DNA polymerase n=1 Tax=Cordylochernes scorpioides TaxID=51811 RepID=A0ABY6LEB5_9ARAC|nr:K02A2.6-like [Cordylochernes scorpioides]